MQILDQRWPTKMINKIWHTYCHIFPSCTQTPNITSKLIATPSTSLTLSRNRRKHNLTRIAFSRYVKTVLDVRIKLIQSTSPTRKGHCPYDIIIFTQNEDVTRKYGWLPRTPRNPPGNNTVPFPIRYKSLISLQQD